MRRNEIHSPHGSLAIGILLLQDLLALVALVLAPVVFGTTGASLGRALTEIVLIAAGADRGHALPVAAAVPDGDRVGP